MGAAGCQLGTRFVCATESIAHPEFKRAFLRASARDAIVSVQIDPDLPVIPVRALANGGTSRFVEMQKQVAERYHSGEISQEQAQLEIELFWAGALKRAVRAYLSQDLADEDLQVLADSAQVKKFTTGADLFREGEAADGLYLIRRGSVTVSRAIGGKEIVLAYVAAGNVVGEMALLSGAPRMATVRAAVNTEAIVLAPDAFNQVVARDAKLRTKLQQLAMERTSENIKMEGDAVSGSLISYLVQQGLGEATDVLLIDESLCIRCNNCEKACADTHKGTSRLNREAGPTFASVHVPTSCRHCEHPHCMKECPPDAIHRSPNGEVFIADTCIGCGNCVRNCPYGVIQMAPVDSRRAGAGVLMWLLGLGSEPGSAAKKKDPNVAKRAVKCDMCRELAGGPACVRACPTGAALRVKPEQFLDYAADPRE